MGPEVAQFLSGMKKTVEQVILPSLTDRFAQEQAGMVAATLGFLAATHDKAFHYELLENHRYKQLLADAVALLERQGSLLPAYSRIIATIREHRAIDPPGSDVHLKPFGFLRQSNETMKEQLCALIEHQSELSSGVRESFDALLQPFLNELELRERSWVKALGFDAMGDQVPSIDELLYRDGTLRLAVGS